VTQFESIISLLRFQVNWRLDQRCQKLRRYQFPLVAKTQGRLVTVSLKEGRSFWTDPPRKPTWQSPEHKASLEFSSTTLKIFSEERLPTSTKSTKRPRTLFSLGRLGSSTLTHSPRYMSSETRYSENKSSTYARSIAIYSAIN
jgi:hypothetical protein